MRKSVRPRHQPDKGSTMILAGDIGGTNTRLALFERRGANLQPLQRKDYRNDDFAEFGAIIAAFVGEAGTRPAVEAACFGVAGLVLDGVCRLTNRDWTIDAAALTQQLGAPARLINDVAAIAAGVVHLPRDAFAVLQEGTRGLGEGNVAVVAAGTGLGQAVAFWDGARHLPFASEAGHADFAAVEPIELELAQFLNQRHSGHASIERVVSGPGLADVADFLMQSGRFAADASLLALPPAERPAEILRRAETGDALARAVSDIFLAALAREAGNAALRYLALGGLVLAGGIPPRLLGAMRRPQFLDRLCDKGRFTHLLRALPIRVALDAQVALLGAAMVAAAAAP
jgi:glucokinase